MMMGVTGSAMRTVRRTQIAAGGYGPARLLNFDLLTPPVQSQRIFEVDVSGP